MLMSGDKDFRPVTRAAWDPAVRLNDLDEHGIDVQLISATPILFQWQRDGAVAADVAAWFNDAALEMCAGTEGRLRALCQVPLQDIDRACIELDRAMASGHVGVQIGNHVGRKDLDDEGLITFLQHCADANAPVFIHPWDMCNPDGRLDNYMMQWTVGMPMETHLTVSAMILGGTFDRLPKSLRVCFAHGGGAFPYLLGRLENAWMERSVARGKSEHPPSHYLDRFSVDSAVFDERAFRLLVETMGASNVLLGSDYPFPLGEQDIGELVRTCPNALSDEQRAMVLGGNAARFFMLDDLLTDEKLPKDSSMRLPDQLQRTAIPLPHEPQPPAYRVATRPQSTPRAKPSSRSPPRAGSASIGAFGAPRPPTGTGATAATNRAFSARRLSTMTVDPDPDASYYDDALHRPLHHQDHSAAPQPTVRNHIGGESVGPLSSRALRLLCQVTGNVRGGVVASCSADVDAAVDAARGAVASGTWAKRSPSERAAVLQNAASLLETESGAFALAESLDTGKPLNLARRLDVPRAVANLRFFAGLVQHGDAESVHYGGGAGRGGGLDDALNFTTRKPLGVVGVITPWNLPLYLLTWKLAPALAMGNCVVSKPSELTPTTATMLADLMLRAGLPAGVFNVVHGCGHKVGARLASHPHVAAVSFTGGTATGSRVAGAVAPRFAKLSMELGGKNPLVVFADCDFETTVAAAVRASFLNSGQICLCASRILVEQTHDGFYERFTAAFAARARSLRLGHPLDASTDVGPLVSAAQHRKVSSYAEQALRQSGVTALSGGPDDPRAREATRAYGDGYWFAPTVLDGCAPDSQVSQEEIFGPVVTLHPFQGDAEAVELANGTAYGLAASVWTGSVDRAHSVASSLQAGTVWVNTWMHRELHMPFGGQKASGVAREGGVHSLDFYSEQSTVCIKLGDRTPLPMPGSPQ